MDFRDIEYFAVLAKHAHVGRAAEALGLSQPALSLSLRRLELAMGTKLAKRTPKGIEITAVGKALLAQVQRLRLAREDVLREAADLSHGRAGHLDIGAHPGVIDDLLAPACSALFKSASNITLTVTIETNDAAVAALREGKLDLIVNVVSTPPPPDIVQEHLFDDTMTIFASASHRLAKRRQVTMDDIAQERWTSTAFSSPAWPHVNQAFQKSGGQGPRIVAQTTSLALRDQLVASTDLLGTSSRRVLRQAATRLPLKALRVKGFAAKRAIAVLHRRDAYLSPAARRFIEILKATAAEIAAAEPGA